MMKEYISVVLSHLVRGYLLQQPRTLTRALDHRRKVVWDGFWRMWHWEQVEGSLGWGEGEGRCLGGSPAGHRQGGEARWGQRTTNDSVGMLLRNW